MHHRNACFSLFSILKKLFLCRVVSLFLFPLHKVLAYFSNNSDILKKLTYLKYSLGPLGDREAIALYTDHEIAQMNSNFQASHYRSVVEQSTLMQGVPGVKSRLGHQWNSF